MLPKAVAAESKAVLALSGPIFVNTVAMVLLITVDMAMVGRLGAAALGVVALANSVAVLTIVLGTGMLQPNPALIARARGAGDDAGIQKAFSSGVAAALLLSIPMAGLLLASEWIIPALTWLKLTRASGVDPEMVREASRYTRILAAGTPFGMAYTACVGSMRGLGRVTPGMVIAIVANGVNLALDYLLIFGHFGAPALGLAGCAWATTLTRVAMFVCALAWLRFDRELSAKLPLRALGKIDRAQVSKLLSLGAPIGARELFDRGIFSAATFVVAQISALELAVNQIALNLWNMLAMGVVAVAIAGSIRIGKSIGAKKPHEARLTFGTAFGLGTVLALILSGAVAAFPTAALRFYTDDPAVLASGVTTLRWAALFILLDCATSMAIHSLIAFLDTRRPSAVGVLIYWLLGLPLGSLLALRFGFGDAGIWIGFCVADVLLVTYLLRRIFQKLPAPAPATA